jgi:hypothetical protein
MPDSIPERDWKYMRKHQETLFELLCQRVNKGSADILAAGEKSAVEKYRALWNHLRDSDRIVADCFDDWRRSTLTEKLFLLKRHGLLEPEHQENLSEATRKRIAAFEQIQRELSR